MRYPGGKGKCYQRLINLMPPHSVYIESHLGGGAVLRNKRQAPVSIGVDIDERVIEAWQAREPGLCDLVHRDAVRYLACYPFSGDELVYADPPYVRSVRRRARVYRYDYTDEQHEELLELLAGLPCNVMISGYENPIYGRRLRDWNRISFNAKTHRDVRTESVWMNFAPPQILHDGTHMGSSYRERQSMRRRHERWVARFDQLPATERAHLLGQLIARYRPADGPA